MHALTRLLPCLIALATATAPTPAAAIWPFTAMSAPMKAETTPVRLYRLSGPIVESPSPLAALDGRAPTVLAELLDALRADLAAPEVEVLLFRGRGLSLSFAHAEELADAIAVAGAAGKRVEVHLDGLDLPSLLAFGGARHLALDPVGTVRVPGLRVEVSFYRELLAQLGLRADLEAVGDYKSAGEAFTRDGMSEAARVNLESLLDDLWRSMRERIAAKRGLSAPQVAALFDRGLMGAERAKAARLIDALTTWTTHRDAVIGRHGSLGVAWPRRDDTPEIGSVLDLLKLLSGAGDKALDPRPAIAVLTASGPIVEGRAGGGLFDSDAAIAAEDFLDDLHEAVEDPRVRAIVVRIDSPGGSVMASELIWRGIAEAGKERPVIASLGAMAASGGYYIASAADAIVAASTTLTGSIGVFGGKLVYGGLLDKVGVRTTVLSRGHNAGLMSGLTTFSDSERLAFRRELERAYDVFLARVATGRARKRPEIEEVAKGRVWTGAQARERGLVDAIGGLEPAIGMARQRAELDADTMQILYWPKPRGLMELLAGPRESSRIGLFGSARLRALAGLPEPLARRIAGAASLLERLLSAGPKALALLPYEVAME